jgi:hypothetical protein
MGKFKVQLISGKKKPLQFQTARANLIVFVESALALQKHHLSHSTPAISAFEVSGSRDTRYESL